MHKCVLKPLRPVVSVALQEFQVRSGAWQELKENLSLAKARQPQEMGVADALPPDPVAVEKIKHKFHTMSKLYSPEKKVTMLLRVCKLIYTIMEDNSGECCISYLQENKMTAKQSLNELIEMKICKKYQIKKLKA